MKPKRVNEANSYLTSPIFPRFISRKRVQQEQALQHADFLEGHARSLGTNLPRSMGALDLLKSEEIGKNMNPDFLPASNDSCPISSSRPWP